MATATFFFPGNVYPDSYTPPVTGVNYMPSLGQILSSGQYTRINTSSTEWLLQLPNGLKLKLMGTDFTFDSQFEPTGGTITGIRVLQNNALAIVQGITGLDLSLEVFAAFAEGTDGVTLGAWVFNGNDTLNGSDGADDLLGYGGDDTLIGGAGEDFFMGGEGADTYDGGDDYDQISFNQDQYSPNVTRGVSVNVQAGTAIDQWGNAETFTSIEGFRGSQFADSFIGSTGNDAFAGAGGRDVIDGAEGVDEARYDKDADSWNGQRAVTVDLATGIAIDGFGKQDTLSNIENVRGTQFGDTLSGNGVANRLRALGGNDTLDGRAGADTMIGGSGDDTYFVDDAGDIVNETMDGGAGIDLVNSAISFSLSDTAHIFGVVENLTLTGMDAINATGNTFANTLTGNGAANTLNGGAGADQMRGGGGNDDYFVDNAGDVVDESIAGSTGTDTVQSSVTFSLSDAIRAKGSIEHLTLTGAAAINATGNALNNTLTGNSGANILNGMGGTDTLVGGAGNDDYIVDNAGDVVDESVGGSAGMDTVQSTVSLSLADTLRVKGSVENLVLLGMDAINATGNTLANTLTGNSAANTLNGGANADQMRGGGGNDIYVVDNAGDVVDESIAGSTGTDTVQSSVTFSLSDAVRAKGSIEHLTLTGAAAINATGNALANTLTGNSGANILNGMSGNDTLVGGAGLDIFLFNTALSASTNLDTISGFSVADDTIRLENAIFTAVGGAGGLTAGAFRIGAAAGDSNDRIIYNPTTGALTYDSNGSAAGGAVQFAKLAAGLALTAADFNIV